MNNQPLSPLQSGSAPVPSPMDEPQNESGSHSGIFPQSTGAETNDGVTLVNRSVEKARHVDLPLIECIVKNDLQGVIAILNSGFDPDAAAKESPPRVPPIAYAAYKNKSEIVTALLAAGSDPDACKAFQTPLFSALQNKNYDMALELLAKGATNRGRPLSEKLEKGVLDRFKNKAVNPLELSALCVIHKHLQGDKAEAIYQLPLPTTIKSELQRMNSGYKSSQGETWVARLDPIGGRTITVIK